MKKISQHISYAEATKSQAATRTGIPNEPKADQLENMKLLAEVVFEPLRKHFKKPIAVTSFFRSPGLNAIIGGSKHSQHCTGEAIDIDADVYGGMTNTEIFEYIKKNLPFDQLIWEYENADGSPAWVHVSYRRKGNRHMILKAQKTKIGTNYTTIA